MDLKEIELQRRIGFIWLKKITNGATLWTRQWMSGFHYLWHFLTSRTNVNFSRRTCF
jgi:hypothetical protein